MAVNRALVGLVWRVLETYDVDPTEIIPASVYRPGWYIDATCYLETREYFRLVGEALRRVDDEAAGIRAAAVLHPGHLGIFGHAWLASPTLLESFRMLRRYGLTLVDDLSFAIDERRDSVRVIYTPAAETPFPEIDADTRIGGAVRLCRLQYGDWFRPLSVSLRHPEPVDREPWDRHFGVATVFRADEDSFVVDGKVANEVLTSACMGLFDRHHDALAQVQAALGEADIVGRVRTAIQQLLPAGAATVGKAASLVNMNVRTLHRRLNQEGITFRDLLKDVRKTLARRYLHESSYNMTEITFMLGFADSSAFSRAFRSWFGTSPTEYRDSRVGMDGPGRLL